MENDNKRNVVLITEDSLQSSLLKDVLESKLAINVTLIAPDKLSASSNPLPDLTSAILLDKSALDEEAFDNYMLVKAENNRDTIEVLFNCDKSISTQETLVWPTLSGIFYTSDDIDTLHTGIGKILQGDMWFSRKFSQEYITHLRRHSRPLNKSTSAVLTKREQQIMTFLSIGASNQQIAQQLLVSENTVKTHLHNIFKKIEVKNRVQALIWVKDNLSDLPQAV